MRAALRILWKIVRVYLMLVGALATILFVAAYATVDYLPIPHHPGPRLAEVQIQRLCGTLELYRLDNGHYPSLEQGLDALLRPPTIEPLPRHYAVDGYARESDLIDPWGNPISYLLQEGRPMLRSLGAPDGKAIVGCWTPAPNR